MVRLERIRYHDQYFYLVKWRGYPESKILWEYKRPLRQDCPNAVDVNEHRGKGRLATENTSHQ